MWPVSEIFSQGNLSCLVFEIFFPKHAVIFQKHAVIGTTLHKSISKDFLSRAYFSA